MFLPDVLFGLFGTVIMVFMTAYLAMVQQNFREQRKVALTMFFLRDRGADHFKVLAISMVIYSASMFAVGIEMIYDSYLLEVFSRITILISMMGLLYFVRGVKIITGMDEDELEKNN